MEGVKVTEYMNTPTSIEMSRFEKPEVKAIEMTKRERVFGMSALFEVKGLEFGYFVYCNTAESLGVFP